MKNLWSRAIVPVICQHCTWFFFCTQNTKRGGDFLQQKHKPQLDCGVDGINIMFATNYELEQDIYHFTRNECNKKIEYATLKNIKATNEQIEYALYVNLPKMLRNTNIQPYSVLDCTKYASVYQFLFDQLTQLFGMNIPELIVTGIECSFSYTLADKELLKPMLNYITKAFISKSKEMHVYVKGVQSKRYKKCEVYCDSLQVQSFRTSRASDCLGSFKCYNKLQELLDHETNSEVREEIIHQMKEKSVLRFEWILNSRGVTRILGQNTVLWSVLSANNIRTLMDSYKQQLFETDQLYDRMNRLGRDIRYIMRKDAQCYNPKEFVLAHKDICELDYSFVKYGLTEKYGGNKRTAQKTASRLKTELADRINFTEGLIEELRLLKQLLLAM